MKFLTVFLPVLAIIVLGVVHGVLGSRVAGFGAELRVLELEKQHLIIQQRELTTQLAELGSISTTRAFLKNSEYISQVSVREVELPITTLSFLGN